MDKDQLNNAMNEIKNRISKKEADIEKAIAEKKSDDYIASLNNALAALQQEKNILLQRESQGNLFKLYTTNLI